MKAILKQNKGKSLVELSTTVAVIALLVVFSLPVLSRVMANMRDQSAIASLWAILEAQKSYRDAQTPTTYANTLEDLIAQGYLDRLPSDYRYVLTATADAFTIELLRAGDTLATIDHNGNFFTGDGGDGGDGGGGGDGGDGGGGEISLGHEPPIQPNP